MTTIKLQKPSETAIKCREAILATIEPFKHQLSAMEILAILSYTVGQAVALQDQRVMTIDLIWDLIGSNIEAGNAHAIGDLANKSAGTA